MKALYFKKGYRYYPIDEIYGFTGFPADGIFLVNDGYEHICDKSFVKEHGESKAVILALITQHLNNIRDLTGGFEKAVNDFSAVSEIKIDFNDDEKLILKNDKIDYFHKKGTTYKKVAEKFMGFESKGVFLVNDGQLNDIKKLNINIQKITLDFDKNIFKKSLIEFINKKPVSYRDITQEAAKLIIELI